MATNGGSIKDANARRRRIVERGSDRLALITGRVQGIPPSPSSPSVAQSHHSYTASCPPSMSRLSDQLPQTEENMDSSVKAETAHTDVGSDVKPFLRKCETTVDAARQSAYEPNQIQSFSVTSADRSPLISTSHKASKSDFQAYLYKTLSPNQLRPAIAASQDIRRKCSLTAAILVLLSYIGFPIVGNFIMRSIILSRPLFLLLLTNITIVVAPLLLENLGSMEKIAQAGNSGSSTGETDFTDHLGLALEWGMLLQTSLSAFFMDCSIYSVVVVCGMSLLQKLGL